MWKTWVQSPCQEYPPEEGNGTPLQYSCLGNPGQRNLPGCSPWGHKQSDTTERLTHFHQYWEQGETKSSFKTNIKAHFLLGKQLNSLGSQDVIFLKGLAEKSIWQQGRSVCQTVGWFGVNVQREDHRAGNPWRRGGGACQRKTTAQMSRSKQTHEYRACWFIYLFNCAFPP